MHGGYSEVYGNCVRMLLKTLTINTCIVREEHYLPIVFGSFISRKAKKALAFNMCSCLCHTCLNALDFFNKKWYWEFLVISTIQYTWFGAFFEILWCLRGSSYQWKYFCCTEWSSKMTLEIGHWGVLHSRYDAWTSFWRSGWDNDYCSHNY